MKTIMEILWIEKLLTSVPMMIALMTLFSIIAAIVLYHKEMSEKCKRFFTLTSLLLQGIAVFAFMNDARLLLYQRESDLNKLQLKSWAQYGIEHLFEEDSPYFRYDDTLSVWAGTKRKLIVDSLNYGESVDIDNLVDFNLDSGPRINYYDAISDFLSKYNSLVNEREELHHRLNNENDKKISYLFLYPAFFILGIFMSVVVWLNDLELAKRRRSKQRKNSINTSL